MLGWVTALNLNEDQIREPMKCLFILDIEWISFSISLLWFLVTNCHTNNELVQRFKHMRFCTY